MVIEEWIGRTSFRNIAKNKQKSYTYVISKDISLEEKKEEYLGRVFEAEH